MIAIFKNSNWLAAPKLDNYLRPPAVLGVAIKDGEEIEWQWTHTIDGRSIVTGYSIRQRWDQRGLSK